MTDSINTDLLQSVADALARFRAVHDDKVRFVREYTAGKVTNAHYTDGITDFAFDLAADGLGLARAVAALLGEDDLQNLVEDNDGR